MGSVGGVTMEAARALDIRRLGIVPYREALDLQRTLVEDRRAGFDWAFSIAQLEILSSNAQNLILKRG